MQFKQYTDTKIFYNDKNLKPDWVEHEAEFTEFHIKRNKKDILLVIGESWTYGESLPRVATSLKKYNFDSQIINGYGPSMSIEMDCDYYQYAVPGNCNAYMFQELGRILKYLWSLSYENIYISMQMTEPGREQSILEKLKDHPVYNLYKDKTKISFEQWLITYDDIFFKIYNDEIIKYKDSDRKIIPILWKNFCAINTPYRNVEFQILTDSWLKCSSVQDNRTLKMPSFYSVGWLSALQENHNDRIEFDSQYINKQLEIIERCNNFLEKRNPNHYPHPGSVKHLLWSDYLLNKTGWKWINV